MFRHPFLAPVPIYITDLLHYPTEHFDSALLELSTGDLIGEIRMAPGGTGLAGLQYFRSLERLIACYGTAFNRLPQLKKSPH